ncbi:uncharacterized protein LOC129457142 [Periophthalmus magnuspinnatus]|uniref:uncharacterized protein LOC129457142 n=1 Tax=Periophthalmus magnuspinnatus TaxID=409849 RepID=UPI0024368E6C|nr:uncharacterized protein LOC129457142 [Periophthalmus magnuspinnatus]
MSGLVNTADEHVFVGLTREWEWTVLDSEDHRQTQIGFEAFGAGEPREEHECGMIQASGEWRTETCNTKWPFVCLDVNVAHKFVKGNGSKVWGQARNYCRTHHTDLARIRSQEENQLLVDLYDRSSDGNWNESKDGTREGTKNGTFNETPDGTWNKTSNGTVYETWNGSWIGLTKRSWSWSDRMYPGFVPWVPEEPRAGGAEACAALHVSGEPMGFVPWNCNDQLPFFCYSCERVSDFINIYLKVGQQ